MKKKMALLIALLLIAQLVKAQMKNCLFDTIPQIFNIYQNLELHQEIRCISYLFVKDFKVFDSLDNVYANLYINTDYTWLTKLEMDGLSSRIFQAAYIISINGRLENYKSSYHGIIVRFLNMDGQILNENSYRIEPYKIAPVSIKNVHSLISALRIPTTMRINDHAIETCFMCVDNKERSAYYLILLRFLKKMNYLDKKWREWRGFYIGCDGEQTQKQYSIKLNDD